jgi:hypothetical protein
LRTECGPAIDILIFRSDEKLNKVENVNKQIDIKLLDANQGKSIKRMD